MPFAPRMLSPLTNDQRQYRRLCRDVYAHAKVRTAKSIEMKGLNGEAMPLGLLPFHTISAQAFHQDCRPSVAPSIIPKATAPTRRTRKPSMGSQNAPRVLVKKPKKPSKRNTETFGASVVGIM